MDPLFERRELIRNVHIQSKFLQKNMLQPLVTQLRMNLEGHCSSEGYIQSQSITILKYSIGRSNYTKGGIDYEVQFQADICFPHQGQVFKAITDVRSKIGIHALLPPLKVLIPRDLHIGSKDFETLEPGKEIEFEVINAVFKQMDKDIIIIGRLRSSLNPAPLMPLLHAEHEVQFKPQGQATSESEEKVVTITEVPQEPKKKRLKRKAVEGTNESLKAGTDESPN
jgi:DNA-directed RNA polymerase subunit E'/Rpb7